MDAVFVGRASELVVLAAALAEARAGRPALVAVHGPAEIGKSALVREFIRTAADAVVLRASGDENERILPFGVLRQLTAQAGSAVPKPLGDLVAGVWPVADPLSVGAALLDLVGVMQGKGPVVLLVDDAQWADQPSLIALGFTLRRLYTDAVLTVVCVREGEEHGLPDGFRRLLAADETQKIDLGGLTPAELCALGAVLGRPALSPMAGRRLFEHTQGNPLHARALLRELPDAAWADLTRPLPRSFAMLVVGTASVAARPRKRAGGGRCCPRRRLRSGCGGRAR